jgi:hypothetical protein
MATVSAVQPASPEAGATCSCSGTCSDAERKWVGANPKDAEELEEVYDY